MDTANSDWRSSRQGLGVELQGKQTFDSLVVLERLGISEVPDDLVSECCARLSRDNAPVEAMRQLRRLTGAADKLPLEDLEPSSRDTDPVKQAKRRREKDMYPHLRTMFQFIKSFPIPSAALPTSPSKYRRHFINDAKYLTQDAHTWGFPAGAPDFTLMDQDVSSTLWRERAAFVEVKPSHKQGPKPARRNDTRALSLVTQCADYARLHLSAKPFQLFSVGLLIFGTRFCVGIFDRDGVTFSPIHDMWQETEEFVRIVRRMACDMSPTDLGQDPTATMLPEGSADSRAAQILATKLLGSGVPTFPSYSISMGGNSSRRWCTVGPPLWNSLSFIGRGTSVWRVAEIQHGRLSDSIVVMKSAWRSSRRLAEADIYSAIVGSHPGVAKLSYGDDVRLSTEAVLSVDALRRCFSVEKETPILHRLFLTTLGRPIWDYNTELELLTGIVGALQGHRFLYQQGILHRDVSAGNVLLSAKPGGSAFITDLEFAYLVAKTVIPQTTVTLPVSPRLHPSGKYTEPTTRIHTTFGAEKPVLRGAAMTGTVQFMAEEILYHIMLGKTDEPPIVHAVTHDIESFCWVLCYGIARKFTTFHPTTEADRNKLKEHFNSCFGETKVDSIRWKRRGGAPFETPEVAKQYLSHSLRALLAHQQTHTSMVWSGAYGCYG
ncbi:hypothetical protein BKA93DRAFT_744886 [Sparassis latifolia]